MEKWKFLTNFAHVASAFQTYYLCLTQERLKKCLALKQHQEVHCILLNCSLSPKAASLLLLIRLTADLSVWLTWPRTRQRPSCPASQMHPSKQQCPYASPSVPSVSKASWRRQVIISAYKRRGPSFPPKKGEKVEKKEARTVSTLCFFPSPTQFQGRKKSWL